MARLLAKYQQNILDMQLLQRRIAWSVVNLYAMAAVISKLQSMLNESGNGNGKAQALKRDLLVGKGFCRRTAEEVADNLRTLFRNQDAHVLAVADEVLGPA